VITAEFHQQKFEFVLKGTASQELMTGTMDTPFGQPVDIEARRSPAARDARRRSGDERFRTRHLRDPRRPCGDGGAAGDFDRGGAPSRRCTTNGQLSSVTRRC